DGGRLRRSGTRYAIGVGDQATHQSVGRVGEIDALCGVLVLDPHASLWTRRTAQHGVDGRGERGLKAPVGFLECLELAPDGRELLVMRAFAVGLRSLALAYDRIESGEGRLGADDRLRAA